jgi:hypothetical protein
MTNQKSAVVMTQIPTAGIGYRLFNQGSPLGARRTCHLLSVICHCPSLRRGPTPAASALAGRQANEHGDAVPSRRRWYHN